MAKQRVEYQEMIDLDGYILRVADARSDYKAFADDVVRLNDLMQKSSLQVRTEIENIRRANASSDDGKAQEAYAQRLAGLSAQYRDQKTAIDALNKVNGQLTEVTGALLDRQTQLLNQYANVNGNTKKDIDLRNRLAKEMINLQNQFDRLDTSTRKSLGATKEVIGQYNLLQKELADARKELKSLDDAFDENTGKLNKNNAAAVALSQRINTADTALKKMDAGMGQYGRNVGNYESAVQGLVSGGFTGLLTSLGLVGVALAKVVDIGGEAIDKMSQFAQNRNGLKAVSDDAKDLAHTEEMLQQLSDRLGLSYLKLSESYKGIKTGTKDTALEGAGAERIFRAFTTRLAELQAPAEKSERALEALSQMISKGNIQAEELRGQLGDAMPGAFKLFADAMGVSTIELNKMLDRGEVLAVDVLPKVADELERTFSGTAAENINEITGATARLDNQTGLLLDQFNQTFGITKFFAKIKNEIADTLSVMRMAVKNGDWLSFFNSLGALTNPLPLLGIEQAEKDPAIAINKQIEEFKALSSKLREAKLKNVTEAKSNALQTAQTTDDKAERDKALTLYKQYSEELLRLQRANLQVSAQERKQARIDEAASDKKYHEDRVAGVVKEAKDMSLAQRNARIGDYKKQIASDQAKLKDNPELATSLNRDIAYAKEFIAAIQGVNKELDKKDKAEAKREAKKDSSAAKAAQQKALQEAKTSLSDSLSTASSNTSAQLATNVSNKENGTIDEKQFIIDRYNITVAGITQRRALLNKAHNDEIIDQKEFDKQIAQLNEETAKAGADYLKGKVDLQEKTFKAALEAVKKGMASDATTIDKNLNDKLADIASAYQDAESKIKIAVASRKITEQQGEEQLHDLKLQNISDVANATIAATEQEKEQIRKRVADLKATGLTETQIAEAVQLELTNINKLDEDQSKATKKRKIDDANEIADAKVKAAQKAANLERQLEEAKYQLISTAVNSYFDTVSAFRQQDLDNLQKKHDQEITAAGDNATAKANIDQRYTAQSNALKRKQAISDKAQAAFNIGLNTFQAIMKTYAEFGFPVGVPLAIAQGAIGAIELAAVLAKPLPTFYTGTPDAPAGPAWVGEKGFELIESKQNGKLSYRLAAEKQVAYLNAHDRVYTHQESKRIIEQNQTIAHEVRTAPGGSLYQPPIINAGINKGEMVQALQEAYEGQIVHQTIIQDGELKTLIKKKNRHTEWLNSYFSLPKKRR